MEDDAPCEMLTIFHKKDGSLAVWCVSLSFSVSKVRYMGAFEDILTREFRALNQSNQQPVLVKNNEQAKFLEVSPAHLSRIRNGESKVTEDLAIKIAKKLRSNTDEQRQLSDELQEASLEGSLQAVSELFHRLQRPDALLCVEYREYPRTDKKAKYAGRYPMELGKAIARGLCFAQFQPFGMSFEDQNDDCHTNTIRSYLENLRIRVRGVYREIRDAALSEAISMQLSEEEKAKINSHMVLYERNVSVPFVGSGIQSRLFYVEIGIKNSPRQHEVWEWVSGEEQDYFVKRDIAESFGPGVIPDQFFPIVPFWRKFGKLPMSNDLDQDSEEIKELAVEDGARMKTKWWEAHWMEYGNGTTKKS